MKRWASLTTATVGLALVVSTPQSVNAQQPPEHATPDQALNASALPLRTASFGAWSDIATPATDEPNRTVARACTPGRDIATPHWVRLTPQTATTVIARTQPTYQLGRVSNEIFGGVAIVSRQTGEVLSCSTKAGLSSVGPLVVEPSGVYVVAFAVHDATPNIILDYPRRQQLYVAQSATIPPANDDISNATPITSLPFTSTVDRHLATSQDEDFGWINGNFCMGVLDPFQVHRSVWYRFVPAEPMLVNPPLPDPDLPYIRIDGDQIAEVTPAGLSSLSCQQRDSGYGRAQVLKAGTTYLVQVSDWAYYDTQDGPTDQGHPKTLTATGTGRLLAPPTVGVEVEAAGAVRGSTGAVALRGTVTCTGGLLGPVSVRGSVAQHSGRSSLVSEYSVSVPARCDGTAEGWTAASVPSDGRYGRGDITVDATVTASNAVGAAQASTRRQLVVQPIGQFRKGR